MLCDGQVLARLAVGGIIGTKTLGIDGVNICHNDASNVDRIFFEIIERLNCVEKGGIIHLGAKMDGTTILVDVALPDVIEHCLGFHGMSTDQDRE